MPVRPEKAGIKTGMCICKTVWAGAAWVAGTDRDTSDRQLFSAPVCLIVAVTAVMILPAGSVLPPD